MVANGINYTIYAVGFTPLTEYAPALLLVGGGNQEVKIAYMEYIENDK